MIRRGLRDAAQNFGQFGAQDRAVQPLFDEIGNAIDDADARAKAASPAGHGTLETGESIKRLAHGGERNFLGGFVAEAYERGAEKALHFRVALDGELFADDAYGVVKAVAGFA